MMPNAYGSNTVSASQNRIQRLRQQNQESRQVSPAANNLLQKRKQMKERRMKRAEAEAAASSSSTAPKVNTSQQDAAIPRRRKLEMVQRHKAHRQANMGNKLLNDDQQNLSPRSVDNEDADDDTLVSVRRIVASSSPSNQQEQQYLNLAPKTTGGGTAFHFQEQQSYQSNYNSLSDNMHSLHKKKTPNKRNGQSRQKYSEQRPWLEDEKSEKVNNQGSYLTASSSEYDTDNQESQLMGLEGHSYSKSADGNDYNSSPLHKQQNSNNNNGDNYYSSRAYPRRFYDDDDKTFDYGDRDDDYSADSGSYAARRWKEAERRKALAAELDSPKENSSAGNASESPFINKEDAEHFRQKIDAMDSPALRIGVGVAGAATIGAVVGPVGLLVGAAAISVGFSLSQIPEADRSKLQTKAAQSMYEFHDKACEVSDKLSNTCATHYHDSGVAEHIPPQIAENLPQCISNPDDQVLDDGVVDDTVLAGNTTDTSGKPTVDTSASKRELPSQSGGGGGGVVKPSGGVGNVRTERVPDPRLPNPTKQPERPYPQSKRNKKVACLRNGKQCELQFAPFT